MGRQIPDVEASMVAGLPPSLGGCHEQKSSMEDTSAALAAKANTDLWTPGIL